MEPTCTHLVCQLHRLSSPVHFAQYWYILFRKYYFHCNSHLLKKYWKSYKNSLLLFFFFWLHCGIWSSWGARDQIGTTVATWFTAVAMPDLNPLCGPGIKPASQCPRDAPIPSHHSGNFSLLLFKQIKTFRLVFKYF